MFRKFAAAVVTAAALITFAPTASHADWGQEDYRVQICVPGNPPFVLAAESRNEESYYRHFGAVDFVNTVDGCGGLSELYTDEVIPPYVSEPECAAVKRVGVLASRVDALERRVERKAERIASLRAKVERLRDRLNRR